MKNLDITLLLDFYGNLLSQRQKEVLDLYYNDDLSLSEIADIVGITRQGVRYSIKRGENELKNLENKLSLAKRFKNIEGTINMIREIAEKLDEGSEIIELIDKIYNEV